jgi:hypothetical protein
MNFNGYSRAINVIGGKPYLYPEAVASRAPGWHAQAPVVYCSIIL